MRALPSQAPPEPGRRRGPSGLCGILPSVTRPSSVPSPTATRTRRSAARGACAAVLAAAGALALPAAAAQAATAALDLPCYVSGHAGTLTLSGFAPNAVIDVANADLGRTQVTTDATGQAAVTFARAPGETLQQPSARSFVVTATETANPASTATASSQVAPLAFATDAGTKSPKAIRHWSFSGFTPGRSIYGHFRLKGLTRGTFRFGAAKGACGLYERRAAGIAIRGHVSTGLWTIQVDQVQRYSSKTRPRLTDTSVVYTTKRPRAAVGAAALSAAALSGGHAFRPWATGWGVAAGV